jgi:hypothetical protein
LIVADIVAFIRTVGVGEEKMEIDDIVCQYVVGCYRREVCKQMVTNMN